MRAASFLPLAFSAATAQGIIESASFGGKGRISPNSNAIPGWHVSGAPDWLPQIMSDRLVLTPPYPGNKRGAVWTDSRINSAQWSVDVEFRASGQEHGSGNLQIWYTRQGQPEIANSNLYTVGTFEGLVLVVDMAGGSDGNGGLRAFLNDGTTDYANHPHIEGLAFGHCDYNYRNLGRPSKISLQQDSAGFQVLVDDHGCFRSNQIILPTDNYFGITASSSENPDSFEIWKFVTSNTPQTPHPDFTARKFETPPAWLGQHHDEHQQQQQQQQQQQGRNEEVYYVESESPQGFEDVLASTIRDQQEQFADLHNRLQRQSHSVDNLFRAIERHSGRVQSRIEELTKNLPTDEQIRAIDARLGNLANKLMNLENKIQAIKTEQKDWSGHFNDIHKSLKVRHDALLDKFPETMSEVIQAGTPNLKLFMFLLVLFQLMLAAAYVVYKRRVAYGPKKYL